jgi:alginate O-acetyltransferase complex protein AlgI
MLFDTPIYFVFLIVVVVGYWRLRCRRRQNLFLLVASYIFYGWWDWRFLALIAVSTVVDFLCAKAIEDTTNIRARRLLLAVSVTLNLTFLGVFKYFGFFVESFAALLHTVGLDVAPPVLQVILPPGISFYTFQELAYIVDVYHRRLAASRSLVDYALFISLFPHLIAGPIQRPAHLLPQVQQPRELDYDRIFDGVLLILSGLFRKVVIADNCALLADAAFEGRLGPPSAFVVLVGVYAFAWQIYGDFSGYSDIARGSAQLLGFHFMVNFRQPYLAVSLQDFWHRWHISLSSWLRDYLYIPLGGNRHGQLQAHRNLLVTMLLGGLWHGANWTFVIWGAIHGAGLAIERLGRATRIGTPVAMTNHTWQLIRDWTARIATFHVVCAAWVFFRASSLEGVREFLASVGTWHWLPEYWTALAFLACFSVPLLMLDLMLEASQQEYLFARAGRVLRLGAALAFLIAITFFAGNQLNAFIYFQF